MPPPKRKFKRTNLEIDEEYLNYFRELFPQTGALKWFVNETFRNFFELYNVDVGEEIRESVRKTVESLKEG